MEDSKESNNNKQIYDGQDNLNVINYDGIE